MRYILLLFLLPLFLQAQDKPEKQKSRTYLDFNVGAAIPVGNYSATDPDTYHSKSGYAATGLFFSAAVAFMGKNDFGIGAKYVYLNNNLTESAKHFNIYGTKDTLGSGNWSNHYLMGGVFFVREIKKLLIDAQATAGFILSMSPVFTVQNPGGRSSHGTAPGFGIGLNAGIGYNISSKMFVKVTAGYLAGFPKYSEDYPSQLIGYDTVTYQPIYSAPIQYEISKTVSTVNVGIGLIFKL